MNNFLPTEPTNELAKQRNREAAERTFAAWIGNCVTLMGMGIAIDRISVNLHRVFPNVNLEISHKIAKDLGLSLIAFSIGLLILVMWQYQILVKSLARDNLLFTSNTALIWSIIIAIGSFGLVAALTVLIRSF